MLEGMTKIQQTNRHVFYCQETPRDQTWTPKQLVSAHQHITTPFQETPRNKETKTRQIFRKLLVALTTLEFSTCVSTPTPTNQKQNKETTRNETWLPLLHWNHQLPSPQLEQLQLQCFWQGQLSFKNIFNF